MITVSSDTRTLMMEYQDRHELSSLEISKSFAQCHTLLNINLFRHII